MTALQVASKAMFILYCIGIGFAGLAIVGALIGFVAGGILSASLNFVLDFVSPSYTLEISANSKGLTRSF